MRVMIVSDTHRRHENLRMALRKMGKIDLLIHLGDAEGREDYIAEMTECPMEIVSGNNDFFSMLEKEKEIRIGKYKALITHGHYYCVNAGLENLRKEAYGRGMDIAMFGHTHRPLIEYDKGVTLINPGSIAYPRQPERKPSFVMMEIDREGEAHFTIHYL